MRRYSFLNTILKSLSYRTYFFLAGISAFLVSLVYLVFPYMIRFVFDEVIPTENKNYLLTLFFIVIALMIFQIILILVRDFLILVFRQDILYHFSVKYLDGFFRLPLNAYDAQMTNIYSDLTNFLNTFKFFISDLISFVFFFILLAIFVLFIMSAYYVEIALISIVFLLCHVLNAIVWGKGNKRASEEAFAKNSDFMNEATHFIEGMTEIKIFNKSDMFINNLLGTNISLFGSEYKKSNYFRAQSLIQNLLIGAQITLTILIGGNAVMQDRVSIGALLMMLLLINHLHAPIYNFSGMMNNMHSANAIFSRIMSMIKGNKEFENTNIAFPAARFEKINFESIYFAYGERNILDNFSAEFVKGSFYCIAGPSGIGKSTLFRLLLRFIEPREGNILIDDFPLGGFSPYILRQRIGLCSQNPWIFHGSLIENIILDKKYDKKLLKKTLHVAGLEDWVSHLEQGLETVLYEQGKNISGGQAQRIQIARVLYRETPVLLFDESTSSLDVSNERGILNELKKLSSEKLIIFITHRKENIDLFDKIIDFKKMRENDNDIP